MSGDWSSRYSRKRVFLFIYVVTVIAFASTLSLESENQLFLLDDYVKVLLAVAMVAIIGATWRNGLLPSMKRINMVGTVFGVVILLASIMAVVVESGNATDVADDFPGIILAVFLIINGVA